MSLNKHFKNEKTGISYTLHGNYYLPDLKLEDKEFHDIGRFGRAHFRYLQSKRPVMLTVMATKGNLNKYLHDIDVQSEGMFSRLVNQIAENEGVTEEFKEQNQMEWVRQMNNIRNRAVEIVNDELIFK